MNTRQTEMIIEKSDRTYQWIVAMIVYLVTVTIWLVFIWQQDRPYMWLGDRFLLMQRDHDIVIRFGIALTMKAVGWFVMFLLLFKYARLNDMMQNFTPPPRAVRFEQETETEMRLVSRTADNQLSRSRFQFAPSDWRLLVNELRIIKPRWNRKALENTRLFPGITAPQEFNKVSFEFERLGVIDGRPRHWRVTDQGWMMLHEVANMSVIT